MCSTRNKAFCHACREANEKCPLNFSKYGDEAFTTCGFNNWKKSLEKFRNEAHKAAVETFSDRFFRNSVAHKYYK